MDVVALGLAKADAARKYAPVRRLRRRDFNGTAALPAVASSPPTVAAPVTFSAGAITSGSAVANPVLVLPDLTLLSCTGCVPKAGALVGGSLRSLQSVGTYTSSSTSPWECEFILDTVGGAFDVIIRDGTGSNARLVVDGQAATSGATMISPGNSGSATRHAVSGLSAGRHRIRLEFTSGVVFCGLVIGNTDGVRAAPKPGLRGLVVGDSFTEPTTVDSTTGIISRGFVQHLGPMLGVDMWSCGSGGTGYLNPGTGGRVKFRDRLAADVIPYAPDVLLWAGGINENGLYDAAAVGAEAALCFAQVAAALPNCQQIVVSPFWPRGHQVIPGTLIAIRDAIKAAATAAGLPFIDMLQIPVTVLPQPSGVSMASTTAGAGTISSSVSFRVGTIVQIDTGLNADIRAVSSVSGTGPYTLSVTESGQTLKAHASGVPIVECGDSMNTGVGTQASPSGGTSSRYTGTDTTHPTQAGHYNIALLIYEQLTRLVAP